MVVESTSRKCLVWSLRLSVDALYQKICFDTSVRLTGACRYRDQLDCSVYQGLVSRGNGYRSGSGMSLENIIMTAKMPPARERNQKSTTMRGVFKSRLSNPGWLTSICAPPR